MADAVNVAPGFEAACKQMKEELRKDNFHVNVTTDAIITVHIGKF